MLHPYRPEGMYGGVPDRETILRSMDTGQILQALCVKCDEHHDLHLDLGTMRGIIPRSEAAIGIAEGKVREIAILSRVGKPVCFQVRSVSGDTAFCSRRAAQLEARSYFLSALRPGDIIPARVQNPTPFGAFCDIGCGFTALMRIDRCCISRLTTAAQLYRPGQEIRAAILSSDDREGQILLTGRELLGTWEDNAQLFRQGQTVTGTVRSVMPYGAFVELTPNLSGLAEPISNLQEGDAVSVFIRAILPEKHKIKLNILEKLPNSLPMQPPEFFITSGHLQSWEYFPGSKSVTYFFTASQ